ncbi:rCG56316 [Rattus norvegicus]|uniref:RCG56316 n=1 Tax=Rattus norvegicus TaxID=10116 RepID=A6IAE8_RAT|nr:rCG56316 [Rattus norvegicus]
MVRKQENLENRGKQHLVTQLNQEAFLGTKRPLSVSAPWLCLSREPASK